MKFISGGEVSEVESVKASSLTVSATKALQLLGAVQGVSLSSSTTVVADAPLASRCLLSACEIISKNFTFNPSSKPTVLTAAKTYTR